MIRQQPEKSPLDPPFSKGGKLGFCLRHRCPQWDRRRPSPFDKGGAGGGFSGELRPLATFLLLTVFQVAFSSPAAWGQAEPWEGPAFHADPRALRQAVQTLPVPEDAEAEVLLYETEYTVEPRGLAAYRERQVYRVLKPSGLDLWSTLEVPWSPWYQERPEIRARVITADGRVQTLDPATIAEAPADPGDPDLFDDERLLRAPLPAVAVGALVETEITVRHSQPLFAAGEVRRQWLAMTVPVRRARVILDAPADLALAVRTGGLGAPPEPAAAGRARRVFELENLPAVDRIDPGLPPEVPLAPYVAFSTGASWSEVARAYSEIVDREIAEPAPDGSPLSAFLGEVEEAPAASQWERIQTLLTLLNREVRYTGLELTDGGIVPRSPHETIAHRFGDCKDKAVLLAALLRREGIPAYVALLNAGVGPDIEEELPGLGLFNHAIVYLPGGSPIWIDATDPYSRLGELPPLAQGRWALVASPNTSGLVRTPEAKPEDNRTEETRDLFLTELGKARLVESSEMIGSPAREIRASWDGAEEEEIRDSLEKYAEETYGASGITRLTYTPLTDPGRELAIELEAEGLSYGVTDLVQGVVLISLTPLFERLPAGLMGDPDEGVEEAAREGAPAPGREHDFVLLEPYRTTWRYRIHIPPNLALREQPEDAQRPLGPAVYQRSFTLGDDSSDGSGAGGQLLTATFTFDTGKRRYSPEEVEAFRRGVLALDEAGEGRMLVWFDQTVQAQLDAGRPREAVAEARRLIELWPERALPRVLLARTLLELGLGREARRQAAEAARVEPGASLGPKAQAWTLVHDEVGRHFHRGFDREGAEAAYRAALELEPDDPGLQGDLAILLEHDADGVRYSEGADLAAAIELYRQVGDALPESGLANNLLIDLLWSGRFDELQDELDQLGDTDERAHLALAATAALEGSDAALRKATRLLDEADARVQALAAAAQQLLLLRRYEEASALFRGAGRSSPNAAALLSLADLTGRLEHHEEMTPSDATPSAVVLAFFQALFSHGEPDLDRIVALFTQPVQSSLGEEGRSELREILDGLLDSVSRQGMPREVLADLVLSALTTQTEGNDARGWKITTRITVGGESNTLTLYAAREGEAYRLVGSELDLGSLGLQALDRLERGDPEGARAWLDWAHEAEPASASEDPLGGRLFLRFWKPDQEAGEEAMRQAAVVLLLDGGDAESLEQRLIPTLEAARRTVPEAERTRFDLGLLFAHIQLETWKDVRTLADRLLAEAPESELAFGAAMTARGRLDDFPGMERLLQTLVARDPESRRIPRWRFQIAQDRGDLEQAAEVAAELIATGDEEVLNNAAWNAVVRERPSEETLRWAQRAAELSGYRNRAELHTLATTYAELAQPAEAYQILLQAMELTAGEPQSEDWYVFGRIAEDYGLPAVARDYYRRVEPPEDEEAPSISTWSLAQRRLNELAEPSQGLEGGARRAARKL